MNSISLSHTHTHTLTHIHTHKKKHTHTRARARAQTTERERATHTHTHTHIDAVGDIMTVKAKLANLQIFTLKHWPFHGSDALREVTKAFVAGVGAVLAMVTDQRVGHPAHAVAAREGGGRGAHSREARLRASHARRPACTARIT